MEGFEKTCPYCGQEVMDDGDPRCSCGCYRARKFRAILNALGEQSGNAAPMREINEDVMEGLQLFAHLICAHKVVGIAATLADGTTVKIGEKVSRTKRIKYEKKVEG